MQGMAICSLIASITVSAALLIFLCFFSHHVDTHRPKGGAAKSARGVMAVKAGSEAANSTMNENGSAAREGVAIKSNDHAPDGKTTTLPFWKWNIGERFVVYLGIVDLCDALINIVSHTCILITHTFPPAPYCKALGFLLNSCDIAQWVVLFLSALSASILIVLNEKLKLGRKDWRLLVAVFGCPLALSCIAAGIGAVGAAGSTCLINERTPNGGGYGMFYCVLQIVFFVGVLLCYGTVWIKIKRTTQLMNADTHRYHNSARLMMIFVFVFIFQWWPNTLFFIWEFFAPPPNELAVVMGFITNLGDVYNCVAYTVIRRRLQQLAAAQAKSSVVMRGAIGTSATCTSTVTMETNLG